jgi:general stress protein 26
MPAIRPSVHRRLMPARVLLERGSAPHAFKEDVMSTPQEIEAKFWKALKSDMTMMLGLSGVDDCHTRPMTAQLDHESRGPIWFFTATDAAIVKSLAQNNRAIATFASKGNDLFASVHGSLVLDNDRAMIDRLWNPFVAAWYESKNDPKIALLRFDAEHAEIWLDASSLLAGIKMLFGVDPKKDYKDKVAEVTLR